MADRMIVIVHGWSDTAEGMEPLAELLERDLSRPVTQLRLADWLSMDDEVTFDDVVTAMQRAWEAAKLPQSPWSTDVVVHSTGGLVVRDWLTRTFTPETSPIKHLLMLAPANFGSPLAHKGHSFIGRIIKGWNSPKLFQTGERILKGLELASPYSWDLALRDRFGPTVFYGSGRVLCTVLVGNTGYSGIAAAANEDGSDGTVRVSTANLNCTLLEADFSKDRLHPAMTLRPSSGQVAFGVMDGENHATIVGKQGGQKNPATRSYFKQAMTVGDADFDAWCRTLEKATADVLAGNATDAYKHGYQNTVTLLVDNFGRHVPDYFLEFYVQDDDADDFARMFHEQVISTAHAYGDDAAFRSLLIDCTLLGQHLDTDQGFTEMRVSLTAMPEFKKNGNVGYLTFSDEDIGAIRLDRKLIASVFASNRTLLARITLHREQAESVFTFKQPR